MGLANLDQIESTIKRLGIECDYQRTGEVSVASEPYQVNDLKAEMEISSRYNIPAEYYDHEKIQDVVKSPLFIAGLSHRHYAALVNPAQLAWGLRQACLQAGVRLYEHTSVIRLVEEDKYVMAHASHGTIRASHIALATNAYPPLLKRLS
jgi:glycine/D-amino acid oxidase-like deaminating enzyme